MSDYISHDHEHDGIDLSTTVPKGPKAITKLIKGGLFLLALSAASSLQQRSYAQIAEAPGSSIFKVVQTPDIRPFPFHSDLAAVSASSGSDIWAVGQSGVHFDGLTWTAFALPHIAGDLTSGITEWQILPPTTFGASEISISMSRTPTRSSSISMAPGGAFLPGPHSSLRINPT